MKCTIWGFVVCLAVCVISSCAQKTTANSAQKQQLTQTEQQNLKMKEQRKQAAKKKKKYKQKGVNGRKEMIYGM
jgi:hypothetical protein